MSVYNEIQKERARQDEKWGVQNHHPIVWLAILGEEFGEACKASLEIDQMDYSHYRKELIETAAVAVAAIESLDRGKWLTSNK